MTNCIVMCGTTARHCGHLHALVEAIKQKQKLLLLQAKTATSATSNMKQN